MKIYISKNEKQTLSFAKNFAKKLKGGDIILLIGNLGSGKTIFVKGIAKALNIKKSISSPTFNIIKIYNIPHNLDKKNKIKYLCHIDAYRLKNQKDLKILGIDEILSSQKTVTLIEWANKVKNILPKNNISIQFKTTNNKNERIIIIHNY
ncbi:MAG: tRNA (adenosine(37)-N6)-threonylcarbamoyltransferase complex ATPase subunit type 1 TsaE [Xanthomonadaceae bacterium]|nr:tRNA (adenosine(37)-N6)-threonylcarbamoyltransferase complex ATPase subunit type 1 TsaE [Rhodospirillaceae bacterium]NIA17593.1 tRNA (adenosine(37)-N6)-threonylcarbamoyltransferase complex ATPase subunit type 1 TsaE [Xanthomonadaceae bacterium]